MRGVLLTPSTLGADGAIGVDLDTRATGAFAPAGTGVGGASGRGDAGAFHGVGFLVGELGREGGLDVEREAIAVEKSGEALGFGEVGGIDVAEELSRLDSHFSEMARLLKAGGELGKRLDFLIQELLREANTLGSKSSSLELTNLSLEMKVLIEQLRELVQNIEGAPPCSKPAVFS